MPLVPAVGGRPRSAPPQRARKIKPQYAQGALVRVAWARNQAEAELIEGMLLEEGIPSLLRRPPVSTSRTSWPPGPRDCSCRSRGSRPRATCCCRAT